MVYRKFFFRFLFLAILVSGSLSMLTSCKEAEPKKLIVFFSHTGNAKFVTEQIQTLTGADVFELKPIEPYTEENVFERFRQESEDGVLPALAGKIDKFDDYDVIFLGSPNWGGTLSLPALSFLNSYDLSGKTVAPFITFGRGGLQNTIDDLKALAPNAIVIEAFGVSRDDVHDSQPAIEQWLERIGMVKVSTSQ